MASLSFAPSIFSTVHPSLYLLRHLDQPTPRRPNSRLPHEFRPSTLHTSSLSHAHGSCVVRTGDTAVVCGVRGEILTLSDGDEHKIIHSDREDEDGDEDALRRYPLLVPNLELNTGCAPGFHPGPPSDIAQEFTERMRRLLVEVVRPVSASELTITSREEEGLPKDTTPRAYWILYIDALLISADGNIFDSAFASVIGALSTTRLPVAYFDPDANAVVCHPTKTMPLTLTSTPFISSFSVFSVAPEDMEVMKDETQDNIWVLADPDKFEEKVCEEKITVVMRDDKVVVSLEKGGGKVSGPGAGAVLGGVAHLRTCVELAGKRWKVWNELLREEMKRKR